MSTHPLVADGNRRLDRLVARHASDTGIAPEQVRDALVAKLAAEPYRVRFRARTEAAFYTTYRVGPQVVLEINTAHPFAEFYFRLPDARSRSQVELMLWALALGEHDTDSASQRRYVIERSVWSQRLGAAMRALGEMFDWADDDTDAWAEDPLDDIEEKGPEEAGRPQHP